MQHPELFDPLYAILEKANPNPDRVGCPSGEELRRLAESPRPPTGLAMVHVTQCFPCYRQYGELRASAVRAAQRRRLMIGIAAGLVLALAGVLWNLRPRTDGSITTAPERRESSEQARVALVDLRRFAVARSEETKGSAPRVAIGRGRLSATIYLPVGSQAGIYDLQILTPSLTSVSATKAMAVIRDGFTIIETDLDLSSTQPGPYQLALRLDDQDWRFYPVQIE